MAYITSPAIPDAFMGEGVFNTEAPSRVREDAMMLTYSVKRVGARPLEFKGVELAMAMSFTPDLPYWYELNLFKVLHGGFVAAVKTFYVSEDERDSSRAWKCDTLDDALYQLESYDPAVDVRVSSDQSNPMKCAAELFAASLDIRARVEAARQHYRGLVGEFMYELDAE